MRHVAIFISLFISSHSAFAAQSVAYGDLEWRWQTNDYDQCGAYAEQKIDLGYRVGEQLSAGVLGWLRVGGCEQQQLQRLYVQRQLSIPRQASLKVGRFERIDTAGYYHLDGVQLSGRKEDAEWQLFAGRPQRLTFYAAPDYQQSADDRLVGERVIGAHYSQRTPGLQRSGEDHVQLGVGLRHFWGDDQRQTRLDGKFGGRWHYQSTAAERLDVNVALSLGLDEMELISFDWHSRVLLSKERFISLRGMTFDPPEAPVDFRERYFRIYAQGRQTQWAFQWEAALPRRSNAGLRLKRILREVGEDGGSLELYGRMNEAWGWDFEGMVGLLDVGDERRRQLYLEAERILSSRSVLALRGSLIAEESLLAGDKGVAAVELSLDRMLRRRLYLQLLLERTWIDYRDYDDRNADYRFSIRLKYELPAVGQKDYR